MRLLLPATDFRSCITERPALDAQRILRRIKRQTPDVNEEVNMICERIELYKENEYDYPMAFGFRPFFMAYLHEDDEIHPAVLIIPGGGYEFVSSREGEIVAKRFFSKGYNTFVLVYTIDLMDFAPLKMQALGDAGRAMRLLRSGKERFGIDPEKIAVLGFSAGGHLAASLAVHHKDAPEKDPELAVLSARPDVSVLCYPVISTTDTHNGTIKALLGINREEALLEGKMEEAPAGPYPMPGCVTVSDELQYASLETQVTEDVPPTFLWHTSTDASVPVSNSYRYAEALKKQGIRHSLHIFSRGKHGLSLANEEWADYRNSPDYTYEQCREITQAAVRGDLGVDEETIRLLQENDHFGSGIRTRDDVPVFEVTVWPEMVHAFIADVLGFAERI